MSDQMEDRWVEAFEKVTVKLADVLAERDACRTALERFWGRCEVYLRAMCGTEGSALANEIATLLTTDKPAKRFDSVADMIDDVSDDPEFAAQVRKDIESKPKLAIAPESTDKPGEHPAVSLLRELVAGLQDDDGCWPESYDPQHSREARDAAAAYLEQHT